VTTTATAQPASAAPHARPLADAVLGCRILLTTLLHWRRHPLTARALREALLWLAFRPKYRQFEPALLVTRSQIDAFLRDGWDYTEERLALLQKVTTFPINRTGVRRLAQLRDHMETARDGSFSDVVEIIYDDPMYAIFQHVGQAFRNQVTGRQPFVLREIDRMSRRPDRICDVGCGSGILLGDVLERCQRASGFGVDVSTAMLQHARAVLTARGLARRANLINGDARRLPFPDDTFDMVLAMEVIEHVPDPLSAVRELARILAPDGVLVTSVPVRDAVPTHLHVFDTEEEVIALYHAAGLRPVRQAVADVAPGIPNVVVASVRSPAGVT
jgi:ubiquinone/menaquinone biosynthesis C-methylase UbiE